MVLREVVRREVQQRQPLVGRERVGEGSEALGADAVPRREGPAPAVQLR